MWLRLFIALALATGTTTAAYAAPATPTDITSFSWTDNDGGADFFDGGVSADKKKCVKQRKVVLYRREGGADTKVTAVKTNRQGAFLIEIEDPGSGKYTVKVKRTEGCKAAKTGLLSVTDLEGV